MAYIPYKTRSGEACLLKRMRFILNPRFWRRINLRMRFILNLLVLNMQLVYIFRNLHLKRIVGVILILSHTF